MEKNIQKNKGEMKIFQSKNWEISLSVEIKNDTIWLNSDELWYLFWRDRTVIEKHVRKIYKDWELNEKWTCAKIAQVQNEWWREVKRERKFFNLDMIISVWYRVDSKQATQFRIWTTKTLKEHITKWFTINKNQIKNNYQNFLKVVDDLKKNIWDLKISNDQVLELVKAFAWTWINLDNFDKWDLPNSWFTKKDFKENSESLYKDLKNFKKDLIDRWQATKLFAQEKNKWNLEWIFWNVFWWFWDQDFYETIEEKAAHFLYFVIKNHPFNDWNKRTWAFCFIWILKKMWINFESRISPETLTVLTLLIAQSKPEDKDRMVWLTLLILQKD